jgi:hypothetical protein
MSTSQLWRLALAQAMSNKGHRAQQASPGVCGLCQPRQAARSAALPDPVRDRFSQRAFRFIAIATGDQIVQSIWSSASGK